MNITHNGLLRPARRFFRGTLVVLICFCTGCVSLPLIKSSKEQVLRKQVEADKFPTANQAGL